MLKAPELDPDFDWESYNEDLEDDMWDNWTYEVDNIADHEARVGEDD